MSIGNFRNWIAGAIQRLNQVVVLMICFLLFFPLFGLTASRERAQSKARPAQAGEETFLPPSVPALTPGQSEEALQKADSARIARLSEIARAINEPGADVVALTTEAARLCGFAIWREDRSKIADPTGAPALKLAVTDTEIREYTEMFRAGHSVALGDLIGAMDVLFKGIGGQGSVGSHLMLWLQSGDRSENPSVRALTAFLQDLGTFRPGVAFGNFVGDTEKLDPIQSLFILRVLTEDMGVPLRKALAKIKPVSPFAESQALNSRPPLWTGIAVGTENAIAGGPRASFEPPPQESEAPGGAEDAYAGGVTGLYGAVSDVMGLGEKAFGRYASGVGKSNAILSIVKFIATYTFLRGEMRVEAPGQPLIRTKDYDPGDKRVVVARFFIDGTRVTDWMKDHRQLVVLAGLDLDMPKTGALKGVRTEWRFAQSPFPRLQLVRTVAGSLTSSLANVRTDDKGEASVQLEGAPQEKRLDPKKVMPIEKVVKITVTPQIKATEMQQDLVDAVLGAIGIKDGPVGFVTPLMETLYRMNWTGEVHLNLRVRDWQQAETMGQLTVEVKAIGREFRKEYALQMTICRSLAFIDTEMRVVGGEMPEAMDQVLKNAPAEQRARMQAQMEAYIRLMTESAKKRDFYDTGLGIGRMSVNDLKSLITKNDQYESSSIETWTATQDFEFSLPQLPGINFSVKIDLEKKTATVSFVAILKVKNVNDSKHRFWPSIPADLLPLVQRPKTHSTKERSMEIFDGLKLQEPPFNYSSETIVIPLKEEPVIDGGGAMNYYGAIPIPFTFGPNNQFKGTALLSYSVTRKVVKPQ